MDLGYPEEALLVGAAESVWDGSDARINISIGVCDRLAACMEQYLPERLETVFITDSDIRHIKKKHARLEEQRGQVNINPVDFRYIPAVINEFDVCEHVDTDKLGNKKFLLRKVIGAEIYIVTVQRGKRKLEIKTMWKEKQSGASC